MVQANDVFYDFGSLLEQQYGAGPNKLSTVNQLFEGNSQQGNLGEFSSMFDQSAERSYTEEGFFRSDPFTPTPKQLDILMQTPDISVFVKKRAFASLAENYRPDLMDKQERFLYYATKILFQNKCNQIQSYERLTKLANVSMKVGKLDEYLLPTLFTLSDNITQLPNALGLAGATTALSGFASIVNRIREIVNLSNDSEYTTWITNMQNSFKTTFGEGTGVIELTNVLNISTTTSINFAEGRFNFTMADPYNIMRISNNDIEQAISDASNSFYNSGIFQLGVSSLNDTIALNKRILNDMRTGRNVSTISFTVQDQVVFGQPVSAVIDNPGFQIPFSGGGVITGFFSNPALSGQVSNAASGSGVSIDSSALQGSSTLGDEGLSPKEVGIFAEIINELFNQISIQNNARRSTIGNNSDPVPTYARKKLRLFYSGKSIVQVMDNVHIYIRSFKNIDSNITAGLQNSFTGSNFMGDLTNSIENITDSFNLSNNFNLEKSIFVGEDFPNWLWMIFRSWFMSEVDGAHVFAGIVDQTNSSFNDGVYHLSVAGSDNAGYFKYGVANIKPSVDVYNGPLYDPLTPFDLKFDSITGVDPSAAPDLISENKELFTSAFVKYKNGPAAGIPPAQNSYFVADAERPQNNTMRQIFYDPEGMVYRWKEGIATLQLFGSSIQSPDIVSAPSITNDPFAGQDIMNVLSLLITGTPYNYATYYKAVSQWDSYFSRDPASNEDPSTSYFRSLENNLKYRNLIYGNFIPFKKLEIDDQTFAKMLYGQLSAQGYNNTIQQLLQQQAALSDKQAMIQKAEGQSTAQEALNAVNSQLAGINTQISNQIQLMSQQINNTFTNQPLSIVGNDVSFDFNSLTNTGSQTTNNSSKRKDLRRKTAFLTRRLSWKVRANEDQNYLIVDDTYDKDIDIQAFEKAFVKPELFKSDYSEVSARIKELTDKMSFEAFANTQGHIEVRNPKYNKIPLPVLNKMFQLSTELGITVYPQFLEDLYISQIKSLQTQIEVFEDQIRLNCLVLGYIDDLDCLSLLDSEQKTNSSAFVFLSDENTGYITINDLNQIIMQGDPDEILNTLDTLLGGASIQTTVSAFDVARQAQVVASIGGTLNSPNQFSNIQQILNSSQAQTRANSIISRLQSKTGQTFDLSQIIGNSPSSQLQNISNMDKLNISNQIAGLLSQRQAIITTYINALQNAEESVKLNQDSSGANKNILSSLFDANNVPQILDHMVEDTTYDDYGPGSGGRFIIKNHDIISWNISEERPAYTSVEVTGRMGDNFIANNTLPSDLNVFHNGGNALTTTAAVDYDLWRMYGIALPGHVDAPFLNDPDTQCPIYAVSLLNKARHTVFKGNVTIVGNEYQQVGEVIYIEDLDQLFYIDSVSHEFTYGNSFTTTLNLSFGHNPGEFIPTPLDVIGKILYKNKDITNFTHKRQGSAFNQQYIGTIVGDATPAAITSGGTDNDIINGPFGDSNTTMIKNIITAALPVLSGTAPNYQPTLELRVYYNTNSAYPNYSSPDEYAINLAESLLNYLNGTNSLSGDTNPSTDPSSSSNNLSAFMTQIAILPVDANPGDSIHPTQPTTLQSSIDNALYSYIVDCWITIKDPTAPTDPNIKEFRYPSSKAYHYARTIVNNNGGTIGVRS